MVTLAEIAIARGFELIPRNEYFSPANRPSKRDSTSVCFCTNPDEWETSCNRCDDLSCINFATYVECPRGRCPADSYCKNQRLQRQEEFPVLEPFQTLNKGYGVRSTEKIKKGQGVQEYVGEIIDQAELDRRLLLVGRHECNFYYLLLAPGVYIDARNKGGFTRFVNHSCDPNCKTEKWTVNGEDRILVVALRNIEPMEELTFDYQWKSLGSKRLTCYCESKNCKGIIGDEVVQEEETIPKGIFREPLHNEFGEYLINRKLRLYHTYTDRNDFSIAIVKDYLKENNTYQVEYEALDEEDDDRIEFDNSDQEEEYNKEKKKNRPDTLDLSNAKWHIYVDLNGLSPEQVQKEVFSIPKVSRSTALLPKVTAESAAKSSSSVSTTPKKESHKLLVKGISKPDDVELFRRILGAHANALTKVDTFFFDSNSGWALLDFTVQSVCEAFQVKLDRRPLSSNTLRVLLATEATENMYYTVKRKQEFKKQRSAVTTTSIRNSLNSISPPLPISHSKLVNSNVNSSLPSMSSSPHSSIVSTDPDVMKYAFGIRLNWHIPSNALENTPNRSSGMSVAVENAIRLKCVQLIQTISERLKCSVYDKCMAIILFYRYFYFQKINTVNIEIMAGSCLHIVLKAHGKNILWEKYVLEVYKAKYFTDANIKNMKELDPQSSQYQHLERQISSLETTLLEAIRYDLYCPDPQLALLQFITALGPLSLECCKSISQRSKKYITDILFTPIWIQYPLPYIIVSVVCISSAYKKLQSSTKNEETNTTQSEHDKTESSGNAEAAGNSDVTYVVQQSEGVGMVDLAELTESTTETQQQNQSADVLNQGNEAVSVNLPIQAQEVDNSNDSNKEYNEVAEHKDHNSSKSAEVEASVDVKFKTEDEFLQLVLQYMKNEGLDKSTLQSCMQFIVMHFRNTTWKHSKTIEQYRNDSFRCEIANSSSGTMHSDKPFIRDLFKLIEQWLSVQSTNAISVKNNQTINVPSSLRDIHNVISSSAVLNQTITNTSNDYTLDNHVRNSQLTAVEMIRKRAYVATIAKDLPVDIANRQVFLQPWPFRDASNLTNVNEIPEACIRELSILLNLDTSSRNIIRVMGIIFPTLSSNTVIAQKHDSILPNPFATTTTTTACTKSITELQESRHHLVFEKPLHILSSLMETHKKLPSSLQKVAIYHLLQALQTCHQHQIVHRFIAPQNLFVFESAIKLGGFSSARYMNDSRMTGYKLNSKELADQCHGTYLHSTAPEILLGDKNYTWRSDIWAAGCAIVQILLEKPLISGHNLKTHVEYVFRVCGSPQNELWPEGKKLQRYKEFKPKRNYNMRVKKSILERDPNFPLDAILLIESMLQIDPAKRLSAAQLLQLPYFNGIEDLTLSKLLINYDLKESTLVLNKKKPSVSTAMYSNKLKRKHSKDYSKSTTKHQKTDSNSPMRSKSNGASSSHSSNGSNRKLHINEPSASSMDKLFAADSRRHNNSSSHTGATERSSSSNSARHREKHPSSNGTQSGRKMLGWGMGLKSDL